MRSFPGRHDSQPISDRRSPYFVRVSVATAKDGNMLCFILIYNLSLSIPILLRISKSFAMLESL
jgi:hypothetical protein